MKADKPRLKCVTYGGRAGWLLRRHFSKYTSKAYLEAQYLLRRPLFKKYIRYFNTCMEMENTLKPCLVSIETINRCNGDCAFCPANRSAESRPFQKMDGELFYKIIRDLEQWGYDGYLNLYVNNEPFIDTRIEEWYAYAKEHLPKARMLLYTNGTLVTEERFRKAIPYIDKMIINNYTQTWKLHSNIQKLCRLVRENKAYWDKDITVQIRYNKEILTNRAGAAPNKKATKKRKRMDKICIMPFTDFTIYPDGTVGLCCSDALEKTCYGNVRMDSVKDIWESRQYGQLRKLIGAGRDNYGFCRGCDFVDAGIRNTFMKARIREGYKR